MKHKITIIITLIFICFVQNSYSQYTYQDPDASPNRYRYGFVDTTGREIVGCVYDQLESFRSGLIKALNNNKHYYLDKLGNVAIKIDSLEGRDFIGEIASFFLNGKLGFINKKGQIVQPNKYSDINPFRNPEGIIKVVLNGKHGYIDSVGNERLSAKYDELMYKKECIIALKNKKYGVLNAKGKEIIPFIYDNVTGYYDGVICVKLGDNWGIIDLSHRFIVPLRLKYDYVAGFDNGYSVVRKNNKYGIINKKGIEIFPVKYDGIGIFSKEGIAGFRLGDKLGFVNSDGKIVVPPKYEDAYPMFNGLSRVKYKGLQGYINVKGEEVITPKYLAASDFSKDYFSYDYGRTETDITRVNLNYKYGFINLEEKVIIPTIYEQTHDFKEGKVAVRLNNKWGFVDTNNKEIASCKYEDVKDFKEGFAAVKLNNKWGFINALGIEVVPLKYRSVISFSEGFATVIMR